MSYQVEEARRMRVCRICHEPIDTSGGGFPRGWEFEFGEMVWPPPAITLNFGSEFAHTKCLAEEAE